MTECPILGMPPQCNDGKSGIKAAYWTSWDDIAGSAIDASGNITSLTQESATTFKTLNLEKEDAKFTSSLGGVVTSRFFAQKVEFMYKKLSTRNRQFVSAAAAVNGVIFILRDWNDNIIVSGLKNGAFLEASEGTSGQKFGEINGEQLTFTANEPDKEYYMSSTIFGGLTVVN
jgi:hypothetical protein